MLEVEDLCHQTAVGTQHKPSQLPAEPHIAHTGGHENFLLAAAVINLDDLTHVDFLEESIGHIPETIFCRYNR